MPPAAPPAAAPTLDAALLAGPVQSLGDVAPMLPAMEARQIVRAHDPDEAHAGATAREPGDGVVGVARADLRLEACDHDARMVGERAGGLHAQGERRQAVIRFEGIARRHEPPDLVEP